MLTSEPLYLCLIIFTMTVPGLNKTLILQLLSMSGAIHKRCPQDFAKLDPPPPPADHIEPTPSPGRSASASIKQNLCWGHIISQFFDKREFVQLKFVNYSIYLYFLESCFSAIKDFLVKLIKNKF